MRVAVGLLARLRLLGLSGLIGSIHGLKWATLLNFVKAACQARISPAIAGTSAIPAVFHRDRIPPISGKSS